MYTIQFDRLYPWTRRVWPLTQKLPPDHQAATHRFCAKFASGLYFVCVHLQSAAQNERRGGIVWDGEISIKRGLFPLSDRWKQREKLEARRGCWGHPCEQRDRVGYIVTHLRMVWVWTEHLTLPGRRKGWGARGQTNRRRPTRWWMQSGARMRSSRTNKTTAAEGGLEMSTKRKKAAAYRHWNHTQMRVVWVSRMCGFQHCWLYN